MVDSVNLVSRVKQEFQLVFVKVIVSLILELNYFLQVRILVLVNVAIQQTMNANADRRIEILHNLVLQVQLGVLVAAVFVIHQQKNLVHLGEQTLS